MLSLRHALAAIGAGALLALSATAARADEPAPAPRAPTPVGVSGIIADAVFLRSGATVRGTIYEIVPGSHVTVLGPGGEIVSIPWEQVSRVELGNRPRAGAVPLPPAAPAVAAPAAPAATGSKPPRVGPMVRLHIDSKRAVQLYRQPAQDSGWYEECSAPCDIDVPLNDEYRISGAGIFQSRDFRLEGEAGKRVVINVDPGTRSAVLVGGVLTGIGGILDYVGLIAAAASASSSSYCYSSDYSCSRDNKSGSMVAAGILIGGTAMMVTGVIMMIANSSTGVSQVEGSNSASARPLDAYKREAVWRAPSPVAATPPAFSVPILSHSF